MSSILSSLQLGFFVVMFDSGIPLLWYFTVLSLYYLTVTRLVHDLTVKQKSWLLTCLVTFLLSSESYSSIVALIQNSNTFYLVFSDSPRGDYACNLFRAFCLADLIWGFLEYREYLNLLEGWIHHIYYLV